MRTQLALIRAAREEFTEKGWNGTRVEDVARRADCSVKTLYNHFKTKHELIARVFGGVLTVIIEDGQRVLNETEDVTKTIEWMLSKLVETSIRRRNITAAMVAAMLEQPLIYPEVDHTPGAKLPEDYGAAIIVAALSDLIELGQEDGLFNADLPAFQVASYHVIGTLLLIAMQPDMATEEVQKIALSQLMPALTSSPGPHEPASAEPDRS